MWPDTMRPDRIFVPGRVGRRAQLAAQARPYSLFFGPGQHDAENGPMGRRPARHYNTAQEPGQGRSAGRRPPEGEGAAA
jgi:hypothetical protein